ncbi:MAG: hypothetical protein EAZ78_21000 [Oscillatoriales cyanobacterium]|uniref:Uncharacterized protein n=1 Tax=Microcoleus anatoxicus PTRS2 TaxID=2705321 RepID=A0ABU8YHZ4_9CYAN|nr:MAG: hypothetical protein EA000_21975 [Oscillatoriales cyanobacterium]TAD92805.1 MAG: hypothetical protein EAZ98_24965 [Oscillatoriales cyanobacterium]TAE01596.1 MAG: hypothetical protein EAZ96_18490 [Oscillatoriales cyanobacterium]TAE99992.1 MAG: hypothetical protein EAZ78_21000 [Oscillatoriales cyanobacterium]TAF44914.1 MAG: hypothetical protein EAZ68_05820 [Oscillatoriales cyanobacterium]
MNNLEASLEVLMLGISSELMSSRQPQEQVRHTLELLQKIYVRIDTIEQSQLNQGVDLRKFRSQLINLLKITVLRESFATIELSQKIDKLLEYLEAIYQQIPLDFLVESTDNLNNPPLNIDSPTDGTFDISFPPLNLGTNPPWTFRGSNERREFTESIPGTGPRPASNERREFTNFIPSTEPPFMASSEGMRFIDSSHGTDPQLL